MPAAQWTISIPNSSVAFNSASALLRRTLGRKVVDPRRRRVRGNEHQMAIYSLSRYSVVWIVAAKMSRNASCSCFFPFVFSFVWTFGWQLMWALMLSVCRLADRCTQLMHFAIVQFTIIWICRFYERSKEGKKANSSCTKCADENVSSFILVAMRRARERERKGKK